MHKALRVFAIVITLMLVLAAGCKEDGAAEPSGSAGQTTGDEAVVTTDSDGKQWVTSGAGEAPESASEDELQGDEEMEMVSPMNVPGMNEFE